MTKEAFLSLYSISELDLEEAKIGWEKLSLIIKEYEKIDEKLHALSKEFIDEYLYDIEKAGIHFHQYITNRFENKPELYIKNRLEDFDEDITHYYIAEKPKVYKRAGDTKIYDKNEIEIIADGIYRSLHYIIKYKGYYVEIQGRTLFEEGWSEIDHDIVYPYNTDDEMLKDFSTLLNRLSGMADEMSSYFRKMKENKDSK